MGTQWLVGEETPQCRDEEGREQLWMLGRATLLVTGDCSSCPHPVPLLCPHHRQLWTPHFPHHESSGTASPLGEIWGCLQSPIPSWAEPLGPPWKWGSASHPPHPKSSPLFHYPATSPWFAPCSKANFLQPGNFIAPSVRNIQRLFNIK